MSKPRTYQTEAIIIKKTKLGEADTIFTLYTPDLGKIEGFARSVRKTKSKLAGHLELLTHSQVSLARGKNLDTIIGSQTIDSFLAIKSDLWLTSCALYASELVNQFTPDDSGDEPLYRLFLETLKQLTPAADKELVLRYFELHLLGEAGYRPQLKECLACHRQLEPVVNSFCPRNGGMLCPDCVPGQPPSYPVSVNAQKVLRLFQDSDYSAVDRIKVSPELSTELERILGIYLKYLLEKDVKSASWLGELREQRIVLSQPATTPAPAPPPPPST
ncbi:MAG: DNA repair protein RecO [Dehalococcoidales bacterium]|nr:DNA repair protein RecO [Dehalococcoidales bacterium]